MTTFPSAGSLDAFNRANGGLGASWATLLFSAAPQILSNAVVPNSGGGFSGGVWTTGTGADWEAYCDLVTLPSGWKVALVGRFDNSTFNGYSVEINSGGINILVNSSSFGGNATLFAAGDKLGVRMVGTTLTVYRYTAGAWNQTPVASVTDATLTGAGSIGFYIQDGGTNTVSIDNFGGGNYVSAPTTTLGAAGHSWVAGYGLTTPSTQRYAALVASHYGEAEANVGVTSSRISSGGYTQGGWVYLANVLTRTAASPFASTLERAIFQSGINDVGNYSGGLTTTNQFLLTNAVRFGISRLICGRVYDETDASVVAAGGFTTNSPGSNDYGTGTTNYKATASGGTITVTTPSLPAGAVVALNFSADTGSAASWSFTVDGVAAGTLVQPTMPQIGGTNTTGVFCKRFTGLSAATHTIVATCTALTTAAVFDSWQIEPATPPLTSVLGFTHLSSAAWAANYSIYVPTNADVDTLNSLTLAVVLEFGPQVTYVPLSSLDYPGYTQTQADGIHPNATMAADIAALIEAKNATGASRVVGGGVLRAAGLKKAAAAGRLIGGGVLSSSGKKTATGASRSIGGGVLRSAGAKTSTGGSRLVGGGILRSGGSKTCAGAGTIHGGGILRSAGAKTSTAAARLAGGGVLRAAGSKATSGTSRIRGGGRLLFTGHSDNPAGLGVDLPSFLTIVRPTTRLSLIRPITGLSMSRNSTSLDVARRETLLEVDG